VVFKKDELDYVLDRHPTLKTMLATIVTLIEIHRITLNKKPHNNYIVCNQDEHYANEVWRVILDGEDKKEHGQN